MKSLHASQIIVELPQQPQLFRGMPETLLQSLEKAFAVLAPSKHAVVTDNSDKTDDSDRRRFAIAKT